MPITPGVDTYGYCAGCHKRMLIERAVEGKVKKWLTADYDTCEFLLDDGSRMRVAMCKECKGEFTEKDYKTLMKTIYNGWERETKLLVKDGRWTKEKRKEYLDRYKKKKIHVKSEGMNENQVKKSQEKLKKDKEEKDKKDK